MVLPPRRPVSAPASLSDGVLLVRQELGLPVGGPVGERIDGSTPTLARSSRGLHRYRRVWRRTDSPPSFCDITGAGRAARTRRWCASYARRSGPWRPGWCASGAQPPARRPFPARCRWRARIDAAVSRIDDDDRLGAAGAAWRPPPRRCGGARGEVGGSTGKEARRVGRHQIQLSRTALVPGRVAMAALDTHRAGGVDDDARLARRKQAEAEGLDQAACLLPGALAADGSRHRACRRSPDRGRPGVKT